MDTKDTQEEAERIVEGVEKLLRLFPTLEKELDFALSIGLITREKAVELIKARIDSE